MRGHDADRLETSTPLTRVFGNLVFCVFCLAVLLIPSLSAAAEAVLYGTTPCHNDDGWEFPPLTRFEQAGTADTYEAGEYIFVDANNDFTIDSFEPCIYPLQDSDVWGGAVPAGSEYQTTGGVAFDPDVFFQNDDGDFIYESGEGVWVDGTNGQPADGLYQPSETVWYGGDPPLSGGEVGARWNTWYITPTFQDQNSNWRWDNGEAVWQDLDNKANYDQGEPVVLGTLGLSPVGDSAARAWPGTPAFYNHGAGQNYRFDLTDAIWNNSIDDGLPWPEVKYDGYGITVDPVIGLATWEGGGTDTFTVVLNVAPTADVVIQLSSDDTTEGTASPGSLTFTPGNWNTSQTVTVTGVDDLTVDGNQVYTIKTDPAVSADANYDGLNPDDVTVTNVDDDVQHRLTVNKSGAGSGTVTSSPAGIDCGGTCSALLLGGTEITLTAVPASGSTFDGWSGGGCRGNGECEFLLDQEYTISALFNTDGDGDGISDVEENAGPGEGDGNADGSLDALQSNVATFSCLTGSYVTIVSEPGTLLRDVVATGNPSSADEPEHCCFPRGFFGFTVKGVTPGAPTTVKVLLHEKNENVSIYYKYGPTPENPSDHWYSFLPVGETGAVISQEGVRTEILLSFRDGQRGDDDLLGNGEITDIGAPTKFTGISAGSADKGCFIATAAYGSPMEHHVRILRDFRDRFLLTNTVGHAFVDLYYACSPPLADFMSRHKTLRTIVRWSLLPLVAASWTLLELGPAQRLPMVSLYGALFIFGLGLFRMGSMKGEGQTYNPLSKEKI